MAKFRFHRWWKPEPDKFWWAFFCDPVSELHTFSLHEAIISLIHKNIHANRFVFVHMFTNKMNYRNCLKFAWVPVLAHAFTEQYLTPGVNPVIVSSLPSLPPSIFVELWSTNIFCSVMTPQLVFFPFKNIFGITLMPFHCEVCFNGVDYVLGSKVVVLFGLCKTFWLWTVIALLLDVIRVRSGHDIGGLWDFWYFDFAIYFLFLIWSFCVSEVFPP